MPSTANTDTVDPGAVDELERLYKRVQTLRSDVSLGGIWIEDETFAELRERIAAGKTTMDDDPPVVEADRPIPITEYVAFDRAFCESEFAALAWLIEARRAIEGTGGPYPIPSELAAAAKRFAEEEFGDAN